MSSPVFSCAVGRLVRGAAIIVIAAFAATAWTDQASAAAPSALKVRAIGDSVTSGFGYCGQHELDGCGGTQDQLMGVFNLPHCLFGTLIENRCSSNHHNPPGYGSSVSWARQFALRERVSDFRNFAVQGATPVDWDVGVLRSQLDSVVADHPDLTLMTLGANPILRALATHLAPGCIVFSNDDNVRKCLREQLAENQTEAHLKSIYERLLQSPINHVVVFLYHNVVPFPAAAHDFRHRVGLALQLINEAVHRAVMSTQKKFPGRITVLAPDYAPWPLQRQCPLVQAVAIAEWFDRGQTGELNPANSSTPFVLDADLCTHPSILGYEQFANRVVRWYNALPRSRTVRNARTPVRARSPLMQIYYRAVQIRRGRPVLHIRLREAATVRIRTRRDPCERALISTGRCPRSIARRRPILAPTVSRRAGAGTLTIRLPVGRGLYQATIAATGRHGTRQMQTVELVCETFKRLTAMVHARRHRR